MKESRSRRLPKTAAFEAALERAQQKILDEIYARTLCDPEAALQLAAGPQVDKPSGGGQGGGGHGPAAGPPRPRADDDGPAAALDDQAPQSGGPPEGPPNLPEDRSPSVQHIFLGGPAQQRPGPAARAVSRGPAAIDLAEEDSGTAEPTASRHGVAAARATSNGGSGGPLRQPQEYSGVPTVVWRA